MRPNLRNAAPGISRLSQALSGGGYQQGYEGEMGLQSKLAQAMAAARASDAHAGLYEADTALKRQELDLANRRPQLLNEQAALESGSSIPLVEAVRKALTTGASPIQSTMGPPDESGGLGGEAIDPAIQSKIALALRRNLVPLMSGTKDISPENWAKTQGLYADQDMESKVASGQMTPMQLAQLRYAAKGSAPYHFDTSGLVGNMLTGNLDESSGRAQAVTGKEKSLGAQAQAGAAENYAQAANANASAAKTRQDIEQGLKNGNLKIITDQDGTQRVVDLATRQAVTITDQATGQPVRGGKVKELTDAQAKANLFGSRMQEADRIISSLAGKYSPAAVNAKMAAENAPLVGGIAGLVGNLMLPEEAQQIEQAQRDFVNAVLRRESGAVISPSEFANAQKQYFPQPNDKPETLAQKARNRKIAIEGLMVEVPEAKRGVPSLTNPSGAAGAKKVVRTGTANGRNVVQYEDGSTAYVD